MAVAWDQETDVLVVGSGCAGCSAALAAVDHGLDVLMVEKGKQLGGGTTYSTGGIWIGENHLAKAAGMEDTKAEAAQYLHFLGAGYEIDENVAAYIEYGPIALKYFADCGLNLQVIPNVPDIYYPVAPGSKAQGRMVEIALTSGFALGDWRERTMISPFTVTRATFDEAVRWGGRGSYSTWDMDLQAERKKTDMRALGSGLIAAFVEQLLKRNVPMLLESPAERLIVEDGRVAGAIINVAGKKRTVRARKAVVLSTGGYESNPDLIKTYEELPEWKSMFPDTVTGDSLIMAGEIGAKIHVIGKNLAMFVGFMVPAHDGKPAMFKNGGTHEVPYAHSFVVNKHGKRFGDESFFQKLNLGLREFDVWTHTYKNFPFFFVMDSQYAARNSFGGSPIGEMPDWVPRADTLEGLAEKLGIDPAGLREQAARFNGFAASGKDLDFQRGDAEWSRKYAGDKTTKNLNPALGTLEKPPFYGVRLSVAGMSSAGLLTGVHGEVLDQRSQPIPGLYATGNTAVGADYGAGYQAGLTLGRGMTYGYRAVKHMTANGVAK
jgi:3-oxosteroid 1-dehydrogenase